MSIPSDTPAGQERDLGIVWEDPPKRAGGRGTTHPFRAWAQILRRKPDTWARLHTFNGGSSANSLATRIRSGEIESMPPDEYEVTGRRLRDGGSALYGRYVGGTVRQMRSRR